MWWHVTPRIICHRSRNFPVVIKIRNRLSQAHRKRDDSGWAWPNQVWETRCRGQGDYTQQRHSRAAWSKPPHRRAHLTRVGCLLLGEEGVHANTQGTEFFQHPGSLEESPGPQMSPWPCLTPRREPGDPISLSGMCLLQPLRV